MAESSDRVALPVRVHDFLLACAGRIDDDALTDARELLAVAELDRAMDLLTASLVAGRIPVSADERDELRTLVAAVRSSPALIDRVVVNDNALMPRHRFTTGVMDDPAPDSGVLDAVGRVIEVLPDIRAMSCVWRATPAGAPAGPVPHRMVLVEIGPDGFPPSTSYRVEQALRRAGIRASVEVIQSGTEVTDYHADALAVARRVSLRPARGHEAEGEPGSSLFADSPTPRTVTSTRRRYASGAHAEKRVDATTGRWQPRIAADESPGDKESDPPVRQIHPPEPAVPPEPVAAAQVTVAPAEPDRPVERPADRPADRPALPPVVEPDADLSTRERELLRQLHEELAKREGEEGDDAPAHGGWQDSHRSGQFHPTEFGNQPWRDDSADQTAVNGIPPYGTQG